ncbi:MAG: endo-1,4-beta-xylanase [Rhizomicrobium sp.]
MLTRRAALAGLGGSLLATRTGAADLRPSEDDTPPLRALAARKGLLFGAANNTYWMRDPDFAAAFARDCGILVPEYELKREVTEPSPGVYDFSAVDALRDFARAHGMLLRGHPLVWFAANPPWLDAAVAAARDETIFTAFIAKTAGRYRGQMHSWDVVNEAIEPADGRADGLRDTVWLRKFGPPYIDRAFAAARAADPQALLVYNEYSIETDSPERDLRRRATLNLLEGLVARGAPIGALGLQGHITAFGPPVNQKKFAAFLDAVRAMGLKLLVTEHDVDDGGGPTDIASRDRAVADASRRYLDVALDNPATLGLLTWGLSDRFLKPEGARDELLRGTPRMLPYDRAMRPTPMYDAIARALTGARKR